MKPVAGSRVGALIRSGRAAVAVYRVAGFRVGALIAEWVPCSRFSGRCPHHGVGASSPVYRVAHGRAGSRVGALLAEWVRQSRVPCSM